MKLNLSTHWNAWRHHDGEEMIAEILELGFDHLELGYDTHVSLIPGIRRMVQQKAVTIESVHNYCPFPIGAPSTSPDIYSLASIDPCVRKGAVIHTSQTAEFASEIGAKVIVTHSGYTDAPELTWKLVDICNNGGQFSDKFEKVKTHLLMKREKHAGKYFNELLRSIEELLPTLEFFKMQLAFEILPFWEAVPIETELEELVKKFNSPWIRAWDDVGHSELRQKLGFTSHTTWLDKLSAYLAGIHVHDLDGFSNDHIMPPHGQVNFKLLKQHFPAHAILVLEPSGKVPANEIIDAVKYLVNI